MAQPAHDLSPSATEAIAEALTQAVAETAVTTMLAQNFHWNVTGMAFGPLHDLFQTIYEDHFVAQDDLSERVRALGVHAEGRLSVMLERSKVEERDGTQSEKEMIRDLMNAQQILAGTLAGAGEIAASHGDILTEDLAVERGRVHEKFAWMLRAHLN
ncbi:Dps family protein [Jannaschia rubra]|uniref:DNA protection during starvation protein 2 n=1 Tax=Jannaschia rubra TaxID=282197 RepID=A0A0M6XT63_9RHOB|nr:DNA starvation/stationary phase protection protein [Jannaschia rubra]CTQ33978.1 DNA protection during starvation protein 2 [Jannaschia rubra]SFG26001.1 starvation-inducible DNA-binding protein [Jannaschia rubra]